MSSTWLPGIGDCFSDYHSFKHKSERDYFASQAKNVDGYIKHTIGVFTTKKSEKVYFCSIYTTKEL